MPHYKNGAPAYPGDIVRGKGYNIKDENGDLAEIVGIITGVTPGSTTCNVTLLVPDGVLGHFTTARAGGAAHDTTTGHIVTGKFEYGQADHFERVL